MEQFKIKKIRFSNFKRFGEETEIDISRYDTIIFGGKNGFGKTTLFDAIELVLTGKIKRYEVYANSYTDKRQSYSTTSKPLVSDSSQDVVKVELLIEKAGQNYWLKRQARTSDMTNPISFTPFATLYRKNENEEKYTEISEAVISQYNFLHYIEQEESTLFLKSKARNRSQDINSLFDIEKLQNTMEKAKNCSRQLDLIIKKYKEELQGIDQKIDVLQIALADTSDIQEAEYTRLLKPNVRSWDLENPQLSKELVEQLVTEEGVLSDMIYYLNHKENYKAYTAHRIISPFLEKEQLQRLAQYIHYKDKKEDIERYQLVQKISSLFDSGINEETLNLFIGIFSTEQLPSLSSVINDLVTYAKNLIASYRQHGELQRSYIDLLRNHHSMLSVLREESLTAVKDCPLCGHQYEDHTHLLGTIEKQSKILDDLLVSLKTDLHKQLKVFEERYQRELLSPLKEQIELSGITQEILESIRNSNIISFLKQINTEFAMQLISKESIEETLDGIRSTLIDMCHPYDEGPDYPRISTFLSEYKEYLVTDSFTLDNVQKKKEYLLLKWREQSSQQLQGLREDRQKLDNKRQRCNDLSDKLKKIQREVSTQKDKYLKKLISDIEILFYIYSGRIMQDSHFGRGVFMKYEENKVLFVTGTHQSDIDCLYNLSSGQISALIIAFILSLNKLYAKCSFLAIDDPVQTIDDMNLWGLIETLRHEFRGYNLLLSTHEEEYAGLLRYKSEKLGLSARVIDVRHYLQSVNKHTQRDGDA